MLQHGSCLNRVSPTAPLAFLPSDWPLNQTPHPPNLQLPRLNPPLSPTYLSELAKKKLLLTFQRGQKIVFCRVPSCLTQPPLKIQLPSFPTRVLQQTVDDQRPCSAGVMALGSREQEELISPHLQLLNNFFYFYALQYCCLLSYLLHFSILRRQQCILISIFFIDFFGPLVESFSPSSIADTVYLANLILRSRRILLLHLIQYINICFFIIMHQRWRKLTFGVFFVFFVVDGTRKLCGNLFPRGEMNHVKLLTCCQCQQAWNYLALVSLVSSKVQLLTYRHKPLLFPNAKKATGTISGFSSLCVWCFVFTTMCIHVACMVLHWEAALAGWHCFASSVFTCIVDRLFHLAQLEFDVHVLPCGPHTPFPGFPNPGRAKGKKWTAQISNAGVPQGWVFFIWIRMISRHLPKAMCMCWWHNSSCLLTVWEPGPQSQVCKLWLDILK